MTNTEITERAMFAVGVNGTAALQSVERAIQLAVSQAYEEAAQTMCFACAEGNTVRRCDVSGHYPYEHHYDDAVFPCAAERIHALVDALAQETVST